MQILYFQYQAVHRHQLSHTQHMEEHYLKLFFEFNRNNKSNKLDDFAFTCCCSYAKSTKSIAATC